MAELEKTVIFNPLRLDVTPFMKLRLEGFEPPTYGSVVEIENLPKRSKSLVLFTFYDSPLSLASTSKLFFWLAKNHGNSAVEWAWGSGVRKTSATPTYSLF